MQKLKKQIIAALLTVLTVLTVSGCPASAEIRLNTPSDNTLCFVNGGQVYIPKDFSRVDRDYSGSYEGCYYDYYYAAQSMEITVIESSVDVYPVASNRLVDTMYSTYKSQLPKATYDVKEKEWFELSGYDGDSIYYIRCKMANQTFYTVWFYYPTKNRKVCDPIVEKVCASFSTDSLSGSPGPADLDAIHSDAKYPNHTWMYLDHYEYATMKNDAYCFKDPDEDVWRKGNYFTVKAGTELTILAKGGDNYACVILTGSDRSGWINMDHMTIQSSRTSDGGHGNTVQETCPVCRGSKRCVYCHGTGGSYTNREPFVWQNCPYCVYGQCSRCFGRGYIEKYS